MKSNMPKTPFSTRLSGSAKETELRIRNIFQWKKKRPPIILFVLAAVLLIAICGGLVGFSDTPRNGTLGEVYQAYFAENPISYIDYENKEVVYPSLYPKNENFGVALEYIRSMELRSVLGQKQYIGDFDNRNGAIVLRSADAQELWIDLYRTGYVVISDKGGRPVGQGRRC